MAQAKGILEELSERFGASAIQPQETRDGIPTAWVGADRLHEVLRWMKSAPGGGYPMLWTVDGGRHWNVMALPGVGYDAVAVLR